MSRPIAPDHVGLMIDMAKVVGDTTGSAANGAETTEIDVLFQALFTAIERRFHLDRNEMNGETAVIAANLAAAVTTATKHAIRLHEHEAGGYWLRDAQGIELCKVCDACEPFKRGDYRDVILTGYSQADVDEPIEPDE